MSGTSLDGIDVAIVDIEGRQYEVRALSTAPYPADVREALLSMSNAPTHTADIARMNFLLPALYARAVKRTCKRASIAIDSLELVGCHGQTIFHEGDAVKVFHQRIASTLQIGDGSVLAEHLGVPVVSDFRPADMAAGGKGAPLVPYVDYVLFRHEKRCRVALNLGGIANITAIRPGAQPSEVCAFDTGPANIVIDQLVTLHTRGAQHFDRGGRIARTGTVQPALLQRLLRDPFYQRPAPKTTGREQYGAAFLRRMLSTGHALPDLIATATALTAHTVAQAVTPWVVAGATDVIASGGGAHNPTILKTLAKLLPQARVAKSSQFGIDPDGKEAIAFAILAHETWHRRPSNLPTATGARHAAILGKLSVPCSIQTPRFE